MLSKACGLSQGPLRENSTEIFIVHDEVLYSKNESPNICNIIVTYFFLLFLGIAHFHSHSVMSVAKACFLPETSWNRDDIICHCPWKNSDSPILLPHYQFTVVSLPINCACLCQPGLVLPGKFTILGAVTLLPWQPPLCHLYCPWTGCHQWGEAWLWLGQAQSHLSKLSVFTIHLWEVICFHDRKRIFPHSVIFRCVFVPSSLPCSLASSRWQASLHLVVSWCPEHLEMVFSEHYFFRTIKKKKKSSPFKAARNTLLAKQEWSIEWDLVRRTVSLAGQRRTHSSWQDLALWQPVLWRYLS